MSNTRRYVNSHHARQLQCRIDPAMAAQRNASCLQGSRGANKHLIANPAKPFWREPGQPHYRSSRAVCTRHPPPCCPAPPAHPDSCPVCRAACGRGPCNSGPAACPIVGIWPLGLTACLNESNRGGRRGRQAHPGRRPSFGLWQRTAGARAHDSATVKRPTEEGSALAMLAKMSTLVPLPSFSSLMVSARARVQQCRQGWQCLSAHVRSVGVRSGRFPSAAPSTQNVSVWEE